MINSPNRVVAIATPLIFAPLAGAVTALAAKYAPGVTIDEGQLQAIFIAGAGIAFAKSGIWMKGWQDFEKRQEPMAPDALESANEMAVADGGEMDLDDDADADALDDDAAADMESAVDHPDLDDDIEDDPDDVMAGFEAAMDDDPDAVPAQGV